MKSNGWPIKNTQRTRRLLNLLHRPVKVREILWGVCEVKKEKRFEEMGEVALCSVSFYLSREIRRFFKV